MRIGHAFAIVSVVAALFLFADHLQAQSFHHPEPLDSLQGGMFTDTLFSASITAFALGHQWGPADLDN